MSFVTTCPSNLTEKILASNRLGCENDVYGNNQYICAPNKAKTSLVEICNDGIMGILEEGNCLSVAGKKYETVRCLNFPSGCPTHYYWSYEFYTHSACQKINTQLHCYEMDPACQLQVPDEVTENPISTILGWTIAAALLVAVVLISVFFGMKFRGSSATCAEKPKQIKETDGMTDTTDMEMNRLGEGDVMSDTVFKLLSYYKELSEIDREIIIPEDIGPPKHEEIALGEQYIIKAECQAREQTLQGVTRHGFPDSDRNIPLVFS